MRKAALQMMDYLQESVAKLSAANLEEAERSNGYPRGGTTEQSKSPKTPKGWVARLTRDTSSTSTIVSGRLGGHNDGGGGGVERGT